MSDVVVIRPATDAVEQTLSFWVDLLLVPGALPPGVVVVADLHGPAQSTPSAVQGVLSKPDVLLYFGHGTPSTLGLPTLLDTATIAGSGAVMVAVACSAAEILGPTAVQNGHLTQFLGFSEPLFLYPAQPALFGYEIAGHIGNYLGGWVSLLQVCADLTTDLKAIEALYRTGMNAKDPDAPLLWMGARMNWRGLELH